MSRWTIHSESPQNASVGAAREMDLEPLGLKDRFEFFLQLSTLFNAGCPLLGSLAAIGRAEKRPSQARVANALLVDIEKGSSVSEAMKNQHPSFASSEIGLVALGEQSGRLHYVLQKVCKNLEQRAENQSRLIQASLYPVVVFLFALVVVGIMTLVLLPRLSPLFESFQVPIPFITKLVLQFSQLSPWLLLLGLTLAVSFLLLFRESERLFLALDASPLVGEILRLKTLSESSSALAILVGSGATLDSSFKLLAEQTESPSLSRSFWRIRDYIRKGVEFKDALELEAEVLPSVFRQLLTSGAETGKIEFFSQRLGEMFSQEFQWRLEQALNLLEPLLLMWLGGVIGFLILSCFLPFYNLLTVAL